MWGIVPAMDLSGVRRDVVLPVRVDPEGKVGPTKDQARGPRWRPSSHGFYVPADVDATNVDQRIVEAAAVLPEDWGAVTGWAALAWTGSRWFDGTPWGGGITCPVTLAVGGNRAIRPQRGIATSEERLLPEDQEIVDGIRLTTAVRSVLYEVRYAAGLRQAVTTIDMACYDDVVSIAELHRSMVNLSGWTGAPLAREALSLAHENSWSPREVGMRMVWQSVAGRPRLCCNVPVFGPDGRFIGTPDLVDPVAGVAGEYDGALHLGGAQKSKDLDREDLFRTHGLEYVTMLAGDVADPTRFLARLAAAYERAAAVPRSRRLWTLERPDWWVDTTTVAARRALDERLRGRLLRYRAA
jgi:hypothetical protein